MSWKPIDKNAMGGTQILAANFEGDLMQREPWVTWYAREKWQRWPYRTIKPTHYIEIQTKLNTGSEQ